MPIDTNVSCRTIIWVGIRENFHDRVYLELLRHDILVKTITLDDLEKDDYSASDTESYIYNLDLILANQESQGTTSSIAQRVINVIKKLDSPKVITHCSLIDRSLKKIFKDAKLVYIERPLDYRLQPVQTLLTLNEIFHRDKTAYRKFIRLEVKEGAELPVSITYGDAKNQRRCGAAVLDLSINGMLLRFSPADLPNPPLLFKDIISLSMRWQGQSIDFQQVVVTRVTTSKNLIGVHFLLNNISFIKPRDARRYEKMIESWLNVLVQSIFHS